MAKLIVSKILDDLMWTEEYKDAKLIVIENYNIIVSEDLRHILFKTYKLLKNYELVRWSTDWKVNGNDDIKTLVMFAQKINN